MILLCHFEFPEQIIYCSLLVRNWIISKFFLFISYLLQFLKLCSLCFYCPSKYFKDYIVQKKYLSKDKKWIFTKNNVSIFYNKILVHKIRKLYSKFKENERTKYLKIKIIIFIVCFLFVLEFQFLKVYRFNIIFAVIFPLNK